MTNTALQAYKQALLNLQGLLNKSLTLVDPSTESITPDRAIGRLTRMEAIQAQQISSASREQMKIRLKQTERALLQVEAGTYGLCARCNDPIPEGRLQVMPEAPFCLICASRK